MIEEAPEPQVRRGVRTRVMDSLNLNALGLLPHNPLKRISDLGSILRLQIDGRFFKGGKTVIKDINDLADRWISAIVGMCLAHDKDGYDAHDAKADELLSPLLSAPNKQLREFYFLLVEKMKADQRVPFLVQVSFDAWGEAVVRNAPDEGIKRLKRKLAADIVDLVEMDVRDQFPEAMRRALMWRDPETLQEFKEVIKSGAKPRVVGRQSCLFLEAGRGKKKKSAML